MPHCPLTFAEPSHDLCEARIGGAALIGGIAAWPHAPDGTPLTLIASIPFAFLRVHGWPEIDAVDTAGAAERFISVFSYYSETDYFLDSITYHGHPEEMYEIVGGHTRVLIHEAGRPVTDGCTIPPMRIDVGPAAVGADGGNGAASGIGGNAGLLQAEPLDLGSRRFALQLYGGDFPPPRYGIFGLSDAIGYLYLDDSLSPAGGLFFVQCT